MFEIFRFGGNLFLKNTDNNFEPYFFLKVESFLMAVCAVFFWKKKVRKDGLHDLAMR